jgi:hypothetical protein
MANQQRDNNQQNGTKHSTAHTTNPKRKRKKGIWQKFNSKINQKNAVDGKVCRQPLPPPINALLFIRVWPAIDKIWNLRKT